MTIRQWLQNHPHALEVAYDVTKRVFKALKPLWSLIGYDRTAGLIRPAEEITKKFLFDCRMCGQCILHSTGMTCSMTCPKNLRNGPCGGVRANGHCEVLPDMPCIWVEAYERAQNMPTYGQEIKLIQPPMNWTLQGQSAWMNMLTGADQEVPSGWQGHE